MWTAFYLRLPLIKVFLLVLSATTYSQVPHEQLPQTPGTDLQYLPAYYHLQTDEARMNFLTTTINDSLRGDNLAHVYDWARRGQALAEQNHIDSLQGRFLVNIAKAQYFYKNNIDSAIHYYKKSLPFFKNPLNEDRIIALRSLMDSYADLGNKDSSFFYLDLTKDVMDLLPGNSPVKYRTAEIIGTDYSWFGLFKSAMIMFDKARTGYINTNNYGGVGMVLSHTALVYDELEDDTKAIEYWKQSLPYLKDSKRAFSTNCSNIANSYLDLNQPDSAKPYLEMSNKIAKEINNIRTLWTNERLNARLLAEEGKYEQARIQLNKCLDHSEKTDDPRSTIYCLFELSNIDSTTYNIPNAIQKLNEALQISKESNLLPEEYKALQGLASLSAASGNYKNAWQYQLDFVRIGDSLSRQKLNTDLADFEVAYNTQQKESQIKLLKAENDMKNLQLQSNRRSLNLYIACFVALLIVIGIIFYQRNLRNKIELQKIKAELTTKVLRLQMNPHFIFNSLNSIENFIMRNEKRLASDYLNKFARLIRMILESSRTEMVPLAKDMEALQLYVDLEQLRFNNKFSYSSYIDPQLLGGDYRAPSLLVQPFVENAIIHGLANSNEENLSLTVSAILENDQIKYIIKDNGIGRSKSEYYNRHNKPNHESIGIKLTEERIRVFNRNRNTTDTIKITDLYDDNQIPGGTEVEITINAV